MIAEESEPSFETLSPQPLIHETAQLTDVTCGAWTKVGPLVRMTETVLGDYSYVTHHSEIIYTAIGKFSNIASHVRINPGNHPMWRACGGPRCTISPTAAGTMKWGRTTMIFLIGVGRTR